MSERLPWKRIIVEGVVIVASILLAFGIEAWWQDRAEADREQGHLTALSSEFEHNRALLREARQYYEARYMDAMALIEFLDGSASEAEGATLETAVGSLFLNRTFHLESGAHDALLSSGELDLIRDEGLRNRLAAWPSYVAEWSEEQEGVFRYVNETVVPVLRDQVQIRGVRGGLPDFPDGEAPPIIPPGGRVYASFGDLTASVEFDNLVFLRAQGLWHAMRDGETLLTQLLTIEDLIDGGLRR